MRILHLTDYHYDSSEEYIFDQKKYLGRILDSVKQSGKVDFVIFSGDLVYSGKEKSEFQNARVALIDETIKALGIERHKFFICQGNHDVNWDRADEVIDFYIDGKIKGQKDLDSFVKDIDSDRFKQSFQICENYYEFLNDFICEQEKVLGGTIHPLYTTQVRKLDSKKIGFVTTNSAWRSVKREKGERGRLLVPMSIVKKALAEVQDCDVKILIQHHPLSYLEDWNQYELQNLIYNNFDLFFTGHEHRPSQGVQFTANDGIITFAGSATLAFGGSTIGCTIVDLDWDAGEFKIDLHQYDPSHDKVWIPFSKSGDIPMDAEKKKANRLRTIIRERFEREKDKANSLFVSYNEESGKDFISMYSNPVLSTLSPVEFHASGRKKGNISMDKLVDDPSHLILFGSDKSGKTSVLMKVQLEILDRFSDRDMIPYFFDSSEAERNKSRFDIEKKLRRRFGLTGARQKEFLKSKQLVLLVDNFHPNHSKTDDAIQKIVKTYSNVKVIFSASSSKSTLYQSFRLQDKIVKSIYIQEISKHHVRELTSKWLGIPEQRKEDVVEKIHKLTKQLSIPFNYWSVSLFLWVFEKTHEDNIHNNINILDLYVERLIDKEFLSGDKRSPFDYEKYRAFLSNLAHWFLKNHFESNYSAPYVEIIGFTDEYLKQNPRNIANPQDVIDYITNKGILRKKENSNFCFRLKGVFEFFLASYMTIDVDFRNHILSSDESYLSFSNELEFYAGLKPDDEDLLAQVQIRTEIAFDSVFKKYLVDGEGGIDLILKSKIREVLDLSKTTNLAQEAAPLSPTESDQLKEKVIGEAVWNVPESELVQKEVFAWDEATTDNLETYLFTFCRVLRNLDEVRDKGKIQSALDYILDATCILGFNYIEEIEDEFDESSEEKDGYLKGIATFLANFVPIITEVFLHDALSHASFKKLYEEKIEELEKDRKNNQYKLFLLYFLMIDIEPSRQKAYVEAAIANINMPVLKSANLMKLYLYKIFSSYKKPEFEKFINNKIMEQSLLINPEIDRGGLQKRLAKDKRSLRPDSN